LWVALWRGKSALHSPLDRFLVQFYFQVGGVSLRKPVAMCGETYLPKSEGARGKRCPLRLDKCQIGPCLDSEPSILHEFFIKLALTMSLRSGLACEQGCSKCPFICPQNAAASSRGGFLTDAGKGCLRCEMHCEPRVPASITQIMQQHGQRHIDPDRRE
jgi:hypothetical protein